MSLKILFIYCLLQFIKFFVRVILVEKRMFLASIKVQKAEKRVGADTLLRMEDLFLKYLVLQSKRTHKFGSPKNNVIGIPCFLKTE
jgi:hypothetical protein